MSMFIIIMMMRVVWGPSLKTINIITKAGRYGIIKIPNKMAMFILILILLILILIMMMRIVWGPSLGR